MSVRTEKPDRNVLVTGASGGLGLETALGLAKHGFRVWAGIRTPGRQQAVEEEARRRGVGLQTLHVDVTEAFSIDSAVSAIESEGGLYALVSNAGVTVRGYFEDLSDAEIRSIFEVNLFGGMNVIRRVLPHMRQRRAGRIVLMSSVAGRIGSMALTAYVASKFALEGFGESLYLELRPLGIQVVIVEPGIVETGIWTENRRIAERAKRPDGAYFKWFRRAEEQADRLVRTASVKAPDVARTILRALTVKNPRLRYMVGRRAKAIVSLRRHVPGELFEQIYFREVLRRVCGSTGQG